MPGPYKITLLANSDVSGWSETYYNNVASPGNAFNKGLAIANVRQSMCPLPTVFAFLRVRQEGQDRASTLSAIGDGSSYPLTRNNWASGSDLYGTAGLGTVYASASIVQRTLTLRGLPDDCFDRRVPDNADFLQWDGIFRTQLRDLLTDTTWLIKTRGGPLFTKVSVIITAWVNQPGTAESSMTVSAPIPQLAVKDQIIVKNSKGIKPAPGIMRVLAISPSGLQLTVEFSLPEDYTYIPGASVYRYFPFYAPITDTTFLKFGHRNTGRPFGGSRGRRPSRAR